MKKKVLVYTTAVFAATIAFGAEVKFPSAGGNLYSEEAWGGTRPGTGDTIVLDKAGTYTASSDLSFGQFKLTVDGVVFDFTSNPNRRITVNNALLGTGTGKATDRGYGYMMTKNGTINSTIKGGYWDFVNTNHFYAVETGNNNSNPSSVTISDGAVITNVARFYFGEHSYGNAVTINNSKIYAQNLWNWATGAHNSVLITNSAQMVLSGAFNTSAEGNAAVNSGFNSLRVTGNGSLLVAPGDSNLGDKHQSDSMYITDHARAELGNLQLGAAYVSATNALLVVDNCATATVANLTVGKTAGNAVAVVSNANTVLNFASISLGEAATSHSNLLLVANGAKASLTGTSDVSIGYRGNENELRIDGATMTFKGITMNTESYGSVSNRLVVVNGARLSTAGCTLGRRGSYARIAVTNSDWTASSTVHVGSTCTGCVFTASGAKLDFANFSTGSNEGSLSNRIEVADSVLKTGVIKSGGKGSMNELLVKDSVVTGSYVKVGEYAGAVSNVMRFVNTTLVTTTGGNDPFGPGTGGELVLDDHSFWDATSSGNSFRFGQLGTNDVMRVLDGSRFIATNGTFSLGYNSAATYAAGLEIGSEAQVDVVRCRLMTIDGWLVISNGTLTATDAQNGIAIGYYEHPAVPVSGNKLIFKGDHPKIDAPVNVSITSRSSLLRFEIPGRGYLDGHIPIESSKLSISAGSTVEIEADEFCERLGGKVVLAHTTSGVTLNAGATLHLPVGTTLAVENNGKDLVFHSPSRRGTQLIFK